MTARQYVRLYPYKEVKMIKYIKGMDLSTMDELEQLGAKYYDHGEEKDILEIMKSYDIDMIRLRLWNDPYSLKGEPYGAGTNDLDATLRMGKKITEAGMKVLLNFHYSDFWAPSRFGRLPKRGRWMPTSPPFPSTTCITW